MRSASKSLVFLLHHAGVLAAEGFLLWFNESDRAKRHPGEPPPGRALQDTPESESSVSGVCTEEGLRDPHRGGPQRGWEVVGNHRGRHQGLRCSILGPNLLVVDTPTEEAYEIRTEEVPTKEVYSGKWKWWGITAVGTKVYAAPCHAPNLLVVDTLTKGV